MNKMSITSLLIPALLIPLSATANWMTFTTENLPSTLVVGHRYSGIVFKVKNISQSPITISINGLQSPPGFSTEGTVSQCPKGLAPGAACTVIASGQYLTNSTHAGEARWSFRFTDSVESYTQAISRKIATTGVIGTFTKKIPPNVEKELKYPVEYTFQSVGGEAKQIKVSKPTEKGLFLKSNCPEVLSPNATCTVSGDYTPPTSALNQTINLPITLHYNDGQTVQLTSHTTVGDIVVNGAITKDLPPTVQQGVSVQLVYTFTNVGNGDATGLHFELPYVGGTGVRNTCPISMMAAQTSCKVVIDFTPSESLVGKPVSFPITLSYKEGMPIKLEAKTKVVKKTP